MNSSAVFGSFAMRSYIVYAAQVGSPNSAALRARSWTISATSARVSLASPAVATVARALEQRLAGRAVGQRSQRRLLRRVLQRDQVLAG
jgi:hypothetical protein